MTISERERSRIVTYMLSTRCTSEDYQFCASLYGVSVQSVKNFVQLMVDTGSVKPARKRLTDQCTIEPAHLHLAIDLLHHSPELYVKEVCDALYRHFGVLYKVNQIEYALQKIGITRKVCSFFTLFLFGNFNLRFCRSFLIQHVIAAKK